MRLHALIGLAVLSALGCATSPGVDDPVQAVTPVQAAGGASSGSGGSAWADAADCVSSEEEDCYSGDPATLGVGTCTSGIRVCENGVWGACQGEVLPTNEICDGASDENCDGQVDEGCCTTTEYELDTGLVSGAKTLCCDSGDQLVDASDCGVGNNHTVSSDGDCATASEGAGNDGSACVHVTCEKVTCSQS